MHRKNLRMNNFSIDQIPHYSGNQLIYACGDILDTASLATKLSSSPKVPDDGDMLPFHLRVHLIQSLRDLHIPSRQGIAVAASLDLMLRQGYAYKKPGTQGFYDAFTKSSPFQAKMIASAVIGPSGVGKTLSIERPLAQYSQVVDHEKMPGFISGFKQLLWLKVDAPNSGKLVDFLSNLMEATDMALGTNYFSATLKKDKKVPADMEKEWAGVARKHMLGILVIEEIQNLFKILPIKERLKKQQSSTKQQNTIKDDNTLKFLITATNSWKLPIMVSGTNDAMAIFQTRASTTGRFITHGYHSMVTPNGADDKDFKDVIFPTLCKYQWVKKKLPNTDEFRHLIYDLTAAIPRVYINLWIAAHSIAFENNRDELIFDDFKNGLVKYMEPMIPAIDAMKSDDPLKLSKYEDLFPRDAEFWVV